MRWPWTKRAATSEPARDREPAAPAISVAPDVLGWWFAPAGAAPIAGRRDVDPVLPAPGEKGLHAARTVLDALEFARSRHLCRVRLSGEIAERGPLIAATERAILWCLDPTPLLGSVVRELARQVLAADPPADLPAACDRARDDVLDAERRIADLEWQLERRASIPPDATRDARAAAARAKARLHALDALRIATAASLAELGRAIDLAIRALAWSQAATLDTLTATDLDRETDRVRAAWSRTLDDRVLAIASATGVDRVPATPAVASETEPSAAPRTTPAPIAIAPLKMALVRAPLTPGFASHAVPTSIPWVSLVSDVAARQPACVAAAPLSLGRDGAAVVVVVEPFDYAAQVIDVIAAVRTAEGSAPEVLALGARTLEASGPDAWATQSLARVVRSLPPSDLEAAIERALTNDPLFDHPPAALGRLPLPVEPLSDVVRDVAGRATARCGACAVLYELDDAVPLEGARCPCGYGLLDRVAPCRSARAPDEVQCGACRHRFQRAHATRHARCPRCHHVGVPRTMALRAPSALRALGPETPLPGVEAVWARELAQAPGVNRAAWLSRDPPQLVIEVGTPSDAHWVHREIASATEIDAIVVVEGETGWKHAMTTGSFFARLADPALPANIARAWRTSTFWSLPGLDPAYRAAPAVPTALAACRVCGVAGRVPRPTGTQEFVCGVCFEARPLAPDPTTPASAPVVAPRRTTCVDCRVELLVWTPLAHVLCPVCFVFQAAPPPHP